ncbi:hypothetical protein FRX31_020360 [Thalictrum thalictroides]|uniref:Uncharacterized protein n=1 Tax=Thalictrum thalictroides TaxID=46969 RepID=A0A7J6VY54_THATH|nr:hypothetical protein FRX31_020360 [Thalictrum thalictroides]
MAEATRSLRSKSKEEYTTMNPQQNNVFGDQAVEGCLPKGFRHTSAPSHYANYQPLGSTLCDCDNTSCKP